MKLLPIIMLVGLASCGDAGDQPVARRSAQPTAAEAPAKSMASKPVAAQAAMIPVPTDKAQLERMLAMGYTVHEDHMHAPGVKECPFNMGGSVVQ
jgi:hypothetical protein